MRKELRTEKRLKTRSMNEVSRLRPLVVNQRKALVEVQTDKKTIQLYREEIARIGQIRKDKDRFRER